MTTFPITFREKDERFIQDAIRLGSYLTQSEVVSAALELLRTRDELRKAKRVKLKQKIQKGIDELDRGESAGFDLRQFLGGMREKRATS